MSSATFLLTLIMCLSPAVTASAQTGLPSRPAAPTSAKPGSIHGKVLGPDGAPFAEAVKVTVKVFSGTDTVLYTDQQGQFEVQGLAPGEYTVEAEADRELKYESATERVQVYSSSPSIVTLTLKEKGSVSRDARERAGVVSAGELDAKVPSKAAKEFERATKAAREGDAEQAVAHLQKAIEIYPDYLMAHNDLGTQFLSQGKLDDAAREFRRAVEIDAHAFNPWLNLLIVLVQQRQFDEAAGAADKALALNPNSPAAQLYAGVAHMGTNDFKRAEAELTAAYNLGGSRFALAQFHLGRLYLNRGDRQLAIKAFETYLREMPDAADAEQVKRLLGALR